MIHPLTLRYHPRRVNDMMLDRIKKPLFVSLPPARRGGAGIMFYLLLLVNKRICS